MKFFSLIFVLFTISLAQNNIRPYQSHSFNDLNYIIQQLIKGIDFYKMDINIASYNTCLTYSTWTGDLSQCETLDSEAICCLSFRGDASSGPILNDYFNLTSEMIDLFNSTRLDFIINKNIRDARYNRTIYFAFNIQYSDVEGQLTKKFMYDLASVIENRDLDIKIFISSAYIDYYAKLCSNGCDAESEVINDFEYLKQSSGWGPNSTAINQSSNVNDELYFGLNDVFPSLPNYCQYGFPLWADPFPYLFYEVAHQTDIQFIANTFNSPTCIKPPSHPTLQSLRMTSNVDPEQVQVYSAALTNFGVNQTNATNPFVNKLDNEDLFLLIFYDALQNITNVELRTINLPSPLQLKGSITLENNLGAPTSSSIKNNTLMLTFDTAYVVYQISLNPNFILQEITSYPRSKWSLAADFIPNSFASALLPYTLVEIMDGTPTCGPQTLQLNVLGIDSDSYSILASNCTENYGNIGILGLGDVSIILENSIIDGLFMLSTQNTGDQKQYIYGFAFTIQSDLSYNITIPESYITFGDQPFIDLTLQNGSIYVLQMQTNSICQCGTGLNNGNIDKCRVSDTTNKNVQYLQNVEYAMTYSWGRYNDFVERIANGNFIDGCDSTIMYGRFNMGTNPNGFLFYNETINQSQALVVSETIDYDDLPLVTRLFCGGTLPSEFGYQTSFKVQVFDVLDVDIFNYLE